MATTTKGIQKKLKARQPRGFGDRLSGDIRFTDLMISRISSICDLYGFDPIETPFLEYSDVLGKFLPDADRPNSGVFSFLDDDEQWLSLRYDLTAPLARHYAEHSNSLPSPYRTWRSGWVFRNEKPGPGRFRQFYQFDVDSVGAPTVTSDAEMCMMLSDIMESVGISRDDYRVRLNNRKVLDGVMEAAGISDSSVHLTVMRAIDKLDRLGIEGVEQLLGSGRKDKSGDFTSGAGLDSNQRSIILDYLSGESNATLSRIDSYVSGTQTLTEIIDLVSGCNYSDRVIIDPCVVRGLEYYTGAVYECELTFEVPNERGQPVVFGSVAGGGRYDGLIERFGSQRVPATGFSVGVSRLVSALKNLGRVDDSITSPVIVCVMDRDSESLNHYFGITKLLRDSGIRAELYQGNPKQLGRQLQYADRRDSPVAIIQGSRERESGVVQVKDLYEGRRVSSEISGHDEWRENPTQTECSVSDLVSVIRGILERNEVKGDG